MKQQYDITTRKDVTPSMQSIHKSIQRKLLSENKQLQKDVESLNKNGYIIIPNILTPQQLDTIKQEALNLLSTTPFSYGFGGKRTKRINSLLSKTRKFDELLLNKRIIDINNYYLLPKHLLSTFQIIEIHPGQTQQALHMDSGSYTYAQKRPRKHPLRIALIWALDDFTFTNGATVFYPKSHLWPAGKIPNIKTDKGMKAIMSKGSVLIYFGTTFHGGGENICDKPRLAITTQYIQPWIRQQENMTLSVPLDMVKELDQRIKSMIGYSVHPPSYGAVDTQHPLAIIPKLLKRYSKL